jgi:hypothetical protein
MGWSRPAALVIAVALGLSGPAVSRDGYKAESHPVYVGARVCARCHSGPETGNQFSHWLLAKHSMAYATLAKPEAKEIAELSGIRVDPQDSFTCLGCHSSGAQAEDWQKDDTFLVEDGVQCETCHGPGSEFIGPPWKPAC